MAAAAGGPPPALPPPASGLFLEVSFRRLLASCEDIAGGTSTSRPDLADCWRHSPVFHHYLEALQEQLADLEASAGTRLPHSTLELYAARVEALAAQLQPADLPAFCTGVAPQPGAAAALQQAQVQPTQQADQQQQDRQAAQDGRQQRQQGAAVAPAVGRPQAAAAAAAPPPRVAVPAPPVAVARTPQLPVKPVGAAAGVQQPSAAAGQPAGAAGPAPAVAAPTSGRLQTQQQLHEDLTEELAGLAAQLKSSTQAIEGRLKERGQLLDSTEAALDTSVQRTKESKERATRVHQRGRSNFCITLLVMFIIGLAFAAMYVFIKVTRLAGYRAPAPVPAAAPTPPDSVPEYEDHYAEL